MNKGASLGIIPKALSIKAVSKNMDYRLTVPNTNQLALNISH